MIAVNLMTKQLRASLAARRYYERNRDKVNNKVREWRKDNPGGALERGRKWRKENVEKCREYRRGWRKNNPERVLEQARKSMKEWREKNPGLAADRQRERRKANPDKYRRNERLYDLKNKYGITPEEWEITFEAQGRCCAGCKTTIPGKRGWQTDHCHETGAFRAILCQPCNLAIGLLKDSPKILRNLASLLEHTKENQ
jgi:hypothetical protein